MKHFYTRRWGEHKSSKKAPLFVLPFCFRRALETFCFFFEEKRMLSFSFLSHVSLFVSFLACVFFKSGRKSICWRCFFHSRTHERFPPQNHSQTTSSYISLYSHWRTTNTITTHISFITRGGAQTQTRVFAAAAAAALSLSLALLLFERKRARKVPFF